jgi:uncharacterized damage-inducible protein DinB
MADRNRGPAADLAEQVLDTWRIHARIQRYVLAGLAPEALAADSGLQGRPVGEQLAHIHNVRLMWLKSAEPGLHDGLTKLGGDGILDHDTLDGGLAASAAAVEALVARGLASGRIKGFKPHPVAFVGYLIAHESYHQGDVGVRLTASGHRLGNKVAFGMWEWGSR